MKNSLLPILVLSITACSKEAPPVSISQGKSTQEVRKCASDPCANTETGEDPWEIDLREARKRDEEIRLSDNDRVRWSHFTIFSDTKHSDQLELIALYTSHKTVYVQ